MARPALVVLIIISRHTSAITIRELWKNMVYYSQVREVWQAQWLHSEVTQVERKCRPIALSLLELRVGYLGLKRSLFTVNLKYNSRNLGVEMEKWGHLKRQFCWARLKVGGEGDDRGWDGWMASLIRCTWIWASSESWWWTGKSGMLQSTGLQRVGYDWATELN